MTTETQHQFRLISCSTLFIICVISSLTLTSQKLYNKTDSVFVNIRSDARIQETGDSSEDNAARHGQLGVSWRKRYLFGSVLFNVLNRKETTTSNDSADRKPFTNSLLTPDQSGKGIANFKILLGLTSIADNEENWDSVPFVSYKRFGFKGHWNVNNTVWTKDDISSPILISSAGINLTYTFLSLQLLNKGKENVMAQFFVGYENRRLGGDFRLEKNRSFRHHFLNTDNLSYDAISYGVRLEIGQIFGQIAMYEFGGSGELDGLSGVQAVISVGMSVELNIAAKESSPQYGLSQWIQDANEKRKEKKKEKNQKKQAKKSNAE